MRSVQPTGRNRLRWRIRFSQRVNFELREKQWHSARIWMRVHICVLSLLLKQRVMAIICIDDIFSNDIVTSGHCVWDCWLRTWLTCMTPPSCSLFHDWLSSGLLIYVHVWKTKHFLVVVFHRCLLVWAIRVTLQLDIKTFCSLPPVRPFDNNNTNNNNNTKLYSAVMPLGD